MRIKYKLMGAMLIIALIIAGASTATSAPNLTLTLNNTMDGTNTPLVDNTTNITSAELLDTSSNTVESATTISLDGMTAQFDLSGISPGDYFIKVNNHAGALVPTRIDSIASDINQSVGRRLRNSVIGDISNPAYRIKSYPSEISSSHPVVNYVTGSNESKYAFVIVPGSTSMIEVRVLNTSEELSNFSTALTTHDGLSVSFQDWILGDTEDSTGTIIGNHGRLGNASVNTACIGCHPSLDTKPTTFPPITGIGNPGWCFRCHNGAGGPSQGFVDPKEIVVVSNGTIAGTVTNVSSGSAIEGATVEADTQSNITDANGNYSINITAGTYTATASATGYQSDSASVTVTSGQTVTLNFALTPVIITPGLAFNISGFKLNASDNVGIAGWKISCVGCNEENTTTDANGLYMFTNLSNGSYDITEETQANFTPVGPTTQTVNVDGSDVPNVNFTNRPVTGNETPTPTPNPVPEFGPLSFGLSIAGIMLLAMLLVVKNRKGK